MNGIEDRINFVMNNADAIDSYLDACTPSEKRKTIYLMCKRSALTIADVNEIFCDVFWSEHNSNDSADNCEWHAFKNEYPENITIWDGIMGLPLIIV